MGKRKQKRNRGAQTTGALPARLGTAAALSPGIFNAVSTTGAIPESWEDRARKAVEYYQEEPLVANALNAWRTFALGDEIGLNSDDEEFRDEAREAFQRLGLNSFVKDMVLQLLIKGDAIGYFIRSKGGDDVERAR